MSSCSPAITRSLIRSLRIAWRRLDSANCSAAGLWQLNTGQFTLIEKLCDDRRIHFLKDAHYVTFGPEPIAAFYLAKESENKNLRMILTGKLVGTDSAVIKERLRETYV